MTPPDELFRLDAICSRFDDAWKKSSEPPELQSFLAEVDDRQQEQLFELLLPIDVEHRRKRSLDCHTASYQDRFPQFGHVIGRVLSPGETVSLNEDSSLKSQADFSGGMAATVGPSSPAPTSKSTSGVPRSGRRQIGRYTVLKELGGGGQGVVYRAAHPTLPIEVAIKVGHRQLDHAARQAMLDEANVLCELDHPNIAKIRDLDFDQDGCPILVLDLVRGRSLHQLLQDDSVSFEQASGWLASAADAVGYAHRRGVLHLDLKPGNIVIDENDKAKVIDFGLARMRDAWSDPASESDGISGTPEYMPPEQAKGVAEKINARSDVFSLGAILYRVLTGSAPFESKTSRRAVLRSRDYDVDLDVLENVNAPRPLIEACRRAISRDPSERFEKAEDFAEALRAIWREEADVLPTPERQSQASHESPPDSRRRWILGAAVAGVSLVIVAVALIAMFGSNPTSVRNHSGASEQEVPATSTVLQPSLNEPLNEPLDGDISLTVVRDGSFIPIDHPSARPLRMDDGLQIDAKLNQPAYLYLIWIDEAGQAQPFYPGTPGDWKALFTPSEPVQSVVLPKAGEGYGLKGQPGMQTILLLARKTPLPDAKDLSGKNISGNDLSDLFAGLPNQTMQDQRALVYWDEGDVSKRTDRGGDFSNRVKGDDPILQTQDILQQNLKEYFPLMRAVSVGFQAD